VPANPPSHPDGRVGRVAGWGGAIALAVGIFAAVTHQVMAGRSAADREILLWMAGRRTPSITTVMVVVTTLGSPRLVTIITLVFLAVLIALRDRWGVIQLTAAGLGTWLLDRATKNLLEQARPTEVVHLVQVSGYSYPSGHALAAAALYLTLAIVAAKYLRARMAKALVLAGAFALITLIGVSRVYLGVHYPTDVIGGWIIGFVWASLCWLITQRFEERAGIVEERAKSG